MRLNRLKSTMLSEVQLDAGGMMLIDREWQRQGWATVA